MTKSKRPASPCNQRADIPGLKAWRLSRDRGHVARVLLGETGRVRASRLQNDARGSSSALQTISTRRTLARQKTFLVRLLFDLAYGAFRERVPNLTTPCSIPVAGSDILPSQENYRRQVFASRFLPVDPTCHSLIACLLAARVLKEHVDQHET